MGISQKVEAIGMFASDGEYVEFGHSVLLEGPVEAWLCDVERSMRWTLKELLKMCRTALKKMGTKRDKWVKEWAGQVCVIQVKSNIDRAFSRTFCLDRFFKYYIAYHHTTISGNNIKNVFLDELP